MHVQFILCQKKMYNMLCDKLNEIIKFNVQKRDFLFLVVGRQGKLE